METQVDTCERHEGDASGHAVTWRGQPRKTHGERGGRQDAHQRKCESVQVDSCVTQWSASIPHGDARSVAWPRRCHALARASLEWKDEDPRSVLWWSLHQRRKKGKGHHRV
uniref:Uncharacterized protein n=1 Tax=Picocystis salinarum TaxID=88271 RepID=A0A7S3UC72_9CHLO